MSTDPTALFVSYSAAAGGSQRLLLDHARGLGGRVALACPEGPLADSARDDGLHVVPLRTRSLEMSSGARDRLAAPIRLAAQGREVRRAVAALRPGCVVAWSMRSLLSSALALAGQRRRPPLVFQHNDFLPASRASAVVRAAAARADRVVAPSRAVANDLDPGGQMNVVVIHPGADLDRFAATPLPPGEPEALVLGAIVGWKRPDLALEAVALARRELPELRVRLAGAPLTSSGHDLAARLRARAEEGDLAGHVKLAGPDDDPAGALAGSTCLLHCADREPFGMALVEALACGRPVAAPRAGGPLEVVDDDCGRLYGPGDPVAAAAALVEVVRCAPQLSAGARERAVRLFDAAGSRARFRELVDGVRG